MPVKPRNGAKAEIKKHKERAWYDKVHVEKKPLFKPLIKTNEIAYILSKNTTVFAAPGADINVLRKKYGIL